MKRGELVRHEPVVEPGTGLEILPVTRQPRRVSVWKQQMADAINAQVDAIEVALVGLSGLDDMYNEDHKIADALRVVRELLELDADNLRRRAQAMLEGK